MDRQRPPAVRAIYGFLQHVKQPSICRCSPKANQISANDWFVQPGTQSQLETFSRFIFDVVGANKCKVIDVSENQIEEIPNKVNLLQKCTKLIVANNLLLRLPKNGLHMKSLKVLNLSRNRLTKICTLDLPNLVELILDNNDLTELPESSFGTMKKLEIFSCSENRIRDVTCVSVCASITDLRLERNTIETIPDEFAF